jgi:hypothetical protein
MNGQVKEGKAANGMAKAVLVVFRTGMNHHKILKSENEKEE